MIAVFSAVIRVVPRKVFFVPEAMDSFRDFFDSAAANTVATKGEFCMKHIKMADTTLCREEGAFRFKEKGIPSIRTGQRGDQYVRIIVEIPKNLSSRQREILEEFAKESNEKNYNQRKKFTDKIKDYFK